VSATYTATNAQISKTLPNNRNLSAGANATRSINLIQPGTMYLDRVNQLDLRVQKEFRLSSMQTIKVNVGLFNALNSNVVLSVNNAYGTNGSSWLKPNEIIQARLVKFEAQYGF
jgi:hypothetical protein